MRIPAVAVGALLFLGAILAGLAAFFITGGTPVGWLWALLVFLGVLTAGVVVAVLQSSNSSTVEES